jgi:hypothetical protein
MVRKRLLQNGTIGATDEKAKGPASQNFFIPSGTRSYARSGHHERAEFRHDSCNTGHR